MIRIIFAIILYSACFTLYANTEADKPISLNFKQTPLIVVLQTLAEYYQLNLVADSNIEQEITLRLQDISLQQALTIIADLGQLSIVKKENILFVRKKIDDPAPPPPLIPPKPLVLLTVKPIYFSAKSLQELLKQQKILSEYGHIFVDDKNNTLIIHDITSNLTMIESIVTALDRPQRQIQISAYIVAMNKDTLDEFGIKWGYNGNYSHSVNQLSADLSLTNPVITGSFQLAKINGHFLNLELSALEAENNIDILANPRLVTSNNETASIKQGTEIPYEVAAGNNGATTIEFRQAVLGLEVTPNILNNNQIGLVLNISQNTIGQAVKRSNGGEALTIDTQEIKTHVIVNNGETIALGGIFQQLKSNGQRNVPVLRRIPVIGSLFRHQQTKQQQRELMIFITPTIK